MHATHSRRTPRVRAVRLIAALLACAAPFVVQERGAAQEQAPAAAPEPPAIRIPAPGEPLYNMAERASAAFPVEFLTQRETILAGRDVFFKRCTFCHVPVGHLGGHAPQLRPNALTADFIFDRVTKGFRLMPAWGPLIEERDRRAVVAYLLSDPRDY